MLNKIRIMNFKSLRDVTIEFAPRFTVFIGENGSGKSSVLQFLAMLKQSNLPSLVPNGYEVRLGELKELVFGGSNNILGFSIYGILDINKIFNKLHNNIILNYEIDCVSYNTPTVRKLELFRESQKVDLIKDTFKEFKLNNISIAIRRMQETLRIEVIGTTLVHSTHYLHVLMKELKPYYFIWVPRGINSYQIYLDDRSYDYISMQTR